MSQIYHLFFPDYIFQTSYPTFLWGNHIHQIYIQVWYQSECFGTIPACSHSDGSVPTPYQFLNGLSKPTHACYNHCCRCSLLPSPCFPLQSDFHLKCSIWVAILRSPGPLSSPRHGWFKSSAGQQTLLLSPNFLFLIFSDTTLLRLGFYLSGSSFGSLFKLLTFHWSLNVAIS